MQLMDEGNAGSYGSGKRPLWMWVVIYAAIGIVVYGLVYYFVLAKRGTSSPSPLPTTPPTTDSQATSSATEVLQDSVILTKDGFLPGTLTVENGTKVTWRNESGTDATVNSSPHPAHTDYQPLNLGSLPNEGTVSLTFDQPGTYKYHNHLSPSQFGTIIVK